MCVDRAQAGARSPSNIKKTRELNRAAFLTVKERLENVTIFDFVVSDPGTDVRMGPTRYIIRTSSPHGRGMRACVAMR